MLGSLRLGVRISVRVARSVVSPLSNNLKGSVSREVIFGHVRRFSATLGVTAPPAPAQFAEAEIMSLDEVVERLCGDDAELEKRLRVLMLEVEVMRQDGRQVPEHLNIRHWNFLLEQPTQSRRKNYLMYLFKNEKSRENRKEKKKERKLEYESKPKPEKENTDDLAYGLQDNAMFLRIRDSSINSFDNYRALQAMMYGQSIVIDCSYDDNMVQREAINAAKQLTFVFGDNRAHRDPFNLHLCNVDMKGQTMKQLGLNIPTLWEPWFPLQIHEKSYTDIFPKKDLVYLTPHCREELTEFDSEAVYIVGCMVDKTNNEPLSLAKAKRDGIRMAKLPLDRYLEWGPGSGKCLNINHMIPILLDLKLTGDWEYSLRHIPRRKLMETKIQAVQKHAEKFSPNFISSLMKQRNRYNDKPKFTRKNFIKRRVNPKGVFSDDDNKF